MKYDDILEYVGEFGPYQKRIIFLLFLPYLTTAFQVLCSVFIIAVPKHRCKIPFLANDSYAVQSESHASLINKTIPTVGDAAGEWSKCTFMNENSTLETCNEWVYDKSTFETTVVSQFDWVCADKALRSHAIMAYMFGMLLGGAIFGPLGDVLGRKAIFLMGVVVQSVASFCLLVAPDFYSFSIFRLIIAIGGMPINSSAYNIGMELVGVKKRVFVSQMMMLSFGVGSVILTGVAYLIRDWFTLHIVLTIPPMFYLSYWWLLPESPRWLLARGRKRDAEIIIRKMVLNNNTEMPPHLLNDTVQDDEPMPHISNAKLWHLFQTPVLAARTLIILFIWMVTTMLYYGISLGAASYHGNIYVNFLLCAVVEFPAQAVILFFVNKYGRKSFLTAGFVCGGLSCISAIFPAIYSPHLTSVTLLMALMGKIGATMSFSMIYMYSAEVFPTVLRAASMGACYMFARIGSIVAPYIADLGDFVGGHVGEALPLLTFGVLALMSGLLALALPETLNRRLPDTIEDSSHFGRLSTGHDEITIEPDNELSPLQILPKNDSEIETPVIIISNNSVVRV